MMRLWGTVLWGSTPFLKPPHVSMATNSWSLPCANR